jgi:GNAT superfamily N-acetyltransferase
MLYRPIRSEDREPLAALLGRVDNFNPEEVEVALELIDDSLERPEQGYECVVAEEQGAVLGYACIGPTPMTVHTWDLYWMAVDGTMRGKGIGRGLCAAIDARIREAGGRIVRAETSSRDDYAGTVAFYLRTGYTISGRIPDFYRPGDDLIILHRLLS